MITANSELRAYMKKLGVPYWKMALALNVAESTFIRWLREELPADKRNAYMKLAEQIAAKEV